jgi:hypothetical protein
VQWQAAADREKASRTLFRQYSIQPELVAGELGAVRSRLGQRTARA